MYNAIIYGFTSPCFGDLAKKITESDLFNSVFYIATDKDYYLNTNKTKVYNIFDLSFCKYPDYIPMEDIEPLDEYVIKEFAECEQICMKMFDRLEFWVDFDYQKRKDFYLFHLKYWYYVINKYDINCLIATTSSHEIFDWIIYCILKKKNAKFLYFETTFFCDRVTYDYDFYYFPRQIEDWNSYMKSTNFNLTSNVIEYYGEKNKKAEVVKKPFYMSLVEKRGKIKSNSKFLKMYNSNAELPRTNEKYVYLALHYQPENTTCPLAGTYVDQYLISDMLSFYLPSDVFLYIKEHPKQTSVGRSSDFYEKIKSRKNVRLIKTEVNSLSLIDNAICVVTCTGTVGCESIIRGKPVILFGNIYYEIAPGVFPVKKKSDLLEALNTIMTGNYTVNKDDVLRYLQFLNDTSIEGYVNNDYRSQVKISDEENRNNIFNVIYKEFK